MYKYGLVRVSKKSAKFLSAGNDLSELKSKGDAYKKAHPKTHLRLIRISPVKRLPKNK
jgi:hypothetical protein